MNEPKEKWDVIVIGGGASGMMSAGRAGELGARVLVLEKNSRLGEKLLITGGGRSNITNHELDDRKLLTKFKNRADFLFSPFSQFSVKETLAFFAAQGMETKLEAEGRMFPKTEKAETVWETLLAYMRQGNVSVRSNSEVTGLLKSGERIRGVKLKNGEELSAHSYVLATGGSSRPETGSSGDGWKWLTKLGHNIHIPTAALVPITTKETWSHKLAGLSLKDVRVNVTQNGHIHHKMVGKMLFTHVGLSGPLILNMSSDIGELLKYAPVHLTIDMFPKMDAGSTDRALQELLNKEQNKKLKNVLPSFIPSALADATLLQLKLDGEKEVNKVSKEERKKIVTFIKAIPLSPTGLLGLHKAVVASGGLDLKEVDVKHMRSKLYENLYVVGDVLDIDRPSGGYSLQLCWTTGWVAGTHAVTKEGLE